MASTTRKRSAKKSTKVQQLYTVILALFSREEPNGKDTDAVAVQEVRAASPEEAVRQAIRNELTQRGGPESDYFVRQAFWCHGKAPAFQMAEDEVTYSGDVEILGGLDRSSDADSDNNPLASLMAMLGGTDEVDLDAINDLDDDGDYKL